MDSTVHTVNFQSSVICEFEASQSEQKIEPECPLSWASILTIRLQFQNQTPLIAHQINQSLWRQNQRTGEFYVCLFLECLLVGSCGHWHLSFAVYLPTCVGNSCQWSRAEVSSSYLTRGKVCKVPWWILCLPPNSLKWVLFFCVFGSLTLAHLYSHKKATRWGNCSNPYWHKVQKWHTDLPGTI